MRKYVWTAQGWIVYGQNDGGVWEPLHEAMGREVQGEGLEDCRINQPVDATCGPGGPGAPLSALSDDALEAIEEAIQREKRRRWALRRRPSFVEDLRAGLKGQGPSGSQEPRP